MRNYSIRLKIVLVVVVLFLVSMGGLYAAIESVYKMTTDTLAQQGLSDARNSYRTLQDEEAKKLSAVLDVLQTREDLQALYLSGDRDALLEASEPLFDQLRENHEITHWYFETTPPDSSVFLRVHKPDEYGDSLTERKVYVNAVESGEIGQGTELGQTAFALRVVKPWADPSGDVVGYLELGMEIDHFLQEMKEETGNDYALMALKSHMDHEAWAKVRALHGLRDNWDDHPTNLLLDSSVDSELLTEFEGDLADVPDEGTVLETLMEGDRTFVRGIFPLYDPDGQIAGGVLVLEDITDVTRGAARIRMWAIVLGAVVSLAFLIVLLLLLDRMVFSRINLMVERLEDASVRLAGGDFDVATDLEVKAHDEIGRFEEFFGKFLRVVASALQDLSRKQ
ncbi:MAG: hypothetical protein Kow0056_05950 [Coriobacteriia bacterium]